VAENEHVLAERREPPGSGAKTCCPGAKNVCADASVGRSHRAARVPGGLRRSAKKYGPSGLRRIRFEHAISLCGRAIAYGSAVNDVAVFVPTHRLVVPIERLAGRAAYAESAKKIRAERLTPRIRSEHAISLCGRAIAYGSAVNDVAVFVPTHRLVVRIERLAGRAAHAAPLKNTGRAAYAESASSTPSRFAAEPSPTARR
jgi:O6-methylguanine-DNA--protein-cysteine methyltransferase